MTQYEVQVVECNGIPFTEYRYEEEQDQLLITIEFSSPNKENDFMYTQPEFVFTDKVCWRDRILEYVESGLDLNIETGVVAGLELVESRSKSGRLTAEPYWLIGVRWGRATELKWYYECELIAYRDVMAVPSFIEF